MSPPKNADKIIAKQNSGGKTLETVINNWLSFIKLRFQPNTVATYQIAARQFLNSLPPRTDRNKVTPIQIEQFLQQLIASGHTEKTANTYLAAIRSFYKWAQNYCSLNNVAEPIKQLREKHRQIYILTDQDYERILDVAARQKHLENKMAIQFLANTGLRRNEFRFLQWSDFNSDFVQITGKGNKCRHVPLNNVCKNIIAQFEKSGSQPPFVARFHYREALYLLCQRIGQKINVNFSPHSFRHYFATRLIRAGVPLIVVSRILGHTRTRTTEEYYVHLCCDDLRVTDCLKF